MVRSPLQKRLASALLLTTIAVQLNVSGAWSALQSIPVFTPFIGVQHADAQSNGNFYVENADPKYGKTWIVEITCRNAAGQNVTYNQGGNSHTLAALVRTGIVTKGLNLTQPQQAVVRSDNGTGAGFNWNDNSGTIHMPTVTAVCQILGNMSDTYVASTCRDTERSGIYPNGKCNFHSPGDNNMHRFTGTLASAACQDGVDNDGDGRVDFPADPGCSSTTDTTENGEAACQDNIDNDGDGLKDFPQDPGCVNAQDTDEFNAPAAQCQNGIDDDNDGRVDFPADAGCSSATDTTESGEAACQDGRDNDFDGAIDFPLDPGCVNATDNDETNAVLAQCQNGIDDDGDGRVDFPNDPGCNGPTDTTEGGDPACADLADNDGDGLVDFPQDPGCSSLTDTDEFNTALPQCRDGIDNDGDGKIDALVNSTTAGIGGFQHETATPKYEKTWLVSITCRNTAGQNVTYNQGGNSHNLSNLVRNAIAAKNLNITPPNSQSNAIVRSDNATGGGFEWNDNSGTIHMPTVTAVCQILGNSSDTYVTSTCRDNVRDGTYPNGRCNFSSPGDNQLSRFVGTVSTSACSDGIDNDNDGLRDFPQDAGCASANDASEVPHDPQCTDPNDTTEADPLAQCQDGIDNDQDGATDLGDFSCSSPTDNDETNPKAACQDGIDNDGDGRTDFPGDVGCVNNQDNDETDPYTFLYVYKTGPIDADRGANIPYSINVRNNGASIAQNVIVQDIFPTGLVFVPAQSTAGCTSGPNTVTCNVGNIQPGQDKEVVLVFTSNNLVACEGIVQNRAQATATNVQGTSVGNQWSTTVHCTAQCQDGIDNDGDGATDFPNDFSCTSPTDNDETNNKSACQDGIDNDADGLVDFPADPGCVSRQDNDEFNALSCTDGLLALPGLQSITVYEVTTSPRTAITFQKNDVRLTQDITPATSNSSDFSTVANERYDVVITDANGVPNPNGRYLTIQEYRLGNSTTEADAANNVDAIALTFADGTVRYADAIMTYQLGSNPLVADGYIQSALGAPNYQYPNEGTFTRLGNGVTSLTVAFNGAFGNQPSCPITAQCRDGIDNDSDGRVDFPADTGCTNQDDNTEGGEAACQDGRDNDADGLVDFPQDPGCTSLTDTDEFNQVQCTANNLVSFFQGNQGPWDDNPSYGDAKPPSFLGAVVPGTNFKFVSAPGYFSARLRNGVDEIPLPCSYGVISFTNDALQTLSKQMLINIPASGFTAPAGTTKAWLSFDESNPGEYYDNSGNRDSRAACQVTLSVTPVSCSATKCSNGLDDDGDGKIDFPADPGCVNAQDNDEYNVATTVDLSIEKIGPQQVQKGDLSNYILHVENAGGVDATNVIITDVLPQGVTYAYSTTSGTCQTNGQTVTCNLGTIRPNFVRDISIFFRADAQTPCSQSTVTNTAMVRSDQAEATPANNTSNTVSTLLTCGAVTPQCRDGVDNDNDGRVDFPADPGCNGPDDTTEGGDPACADRVDNDGDGLVDFPLDPGCSSLADTDEFNSPLPACRDGIDNDNDGRVDSLDPGCSNPDDTNEGDDPACSDRIDNDSDGLIDFPFDPGCVSPTDTDEFNQVQTVDLTIQKAGPQTVVRGQPLFYSILVGNSGTSQATNVVVTDAAPAGLVYNDALSYGPCSAVAGQVTCPLGTLAANQFGSFYIAFDTPAVQNCSQVSVTNVATISGTQTDSNPTNNTSSTLASPTRIDCPVQTTQCNDFNDNDFDGRIDFPADPGCSSPADNNENDEAACQDGRDNDNDGRVDFPQDPGCTGPTDTDETDPVTPPQCRDGIDNDNDGRVDFPADPGCSNQDDNTEGGDPACADRIDNDSDGLTDFPQDPGCVSLADTDEFNAPNTQCRDGVDNDGDGRVDTNDAGCSNGDDNNEGDGAADLGIALTGPATVQGGSTAAYVATVSNNGPDAATSPFSIRVSIPTGVAFNAAQSSQGCTQQGSAIICSNITLGLFQQTTRSIVFNVPGNGQQVASTFNLVNFALGVETAHAQVVGGVCNTTIVVVGTIQGVQPDPNQSNNQSQVSTFVSCQALAQCQDGIDNDNDGKVDFPADPGCSSATDTDETDVAQFGCVEIKKETFDPHGNPLPIAAQFTFILDATRVAYNDASGRARFDNLTAGAHSVAEIIPSGWTQLSVSPQNGMVTVTPGTTCAQVTFRNRQVFVANAQCADGYDNDGDGATDYPQDQGCSSATDNDEYNSTFVPQCSDNVDNDGDGLKDFPLDTGCENAADNNEQNAGVPIVYACSDNVDNDGDGLKDYPLDPGCVSAQDTDETNGVVGTFACNDGIDNDNDGLKDYPQDTGCSSAQDTDEFNFRAARCSDGIDNDGDGLKDYPQDTGCTTAYDDNEYNDRLWLDRWREFWNWNW